MLEQGRTTEQGTYDELMAKGGIYRQLATAEPNGIAFHSRRWSGHEVQHDAGQSCRQGGRDEDAAPDIHVYSQRIIEFR